MQVTANEFLMLICTLVVIIASLCAYAFKVNSTLRDTKRALQEVQQKSLALQAEVVALKKIADKQKPSDKDEFTKPLNYPKSNNA